MNHNILIEDKFVKKRSRSGLITLVESVGLVLLFLMMVFPRTYQLVKMPFLGVYLVSGVIFILVSGKINIHRKVLVWFSTYLFYGILWSSIGFINGKNLQVIL